MENFDSKKYALNPKTNRFVEKGKPIYKRLVKEGVIKENEEYKPPALVIEKKVKAVANVKDLSKSEIEDIYDQIKALRIKKDAIVERRSQGRPIGTLVNKERPKYKEEMKMSKKPTYNIKVIPTSPQTDTEYELGETTDA